MKTKGLQPLPQTAMTAARLREMAREMLVQAAALEALSKTARTKKQITLIDPREQSSMEKSC